MLNESSKRVREKSSELKSLILDLHRLSSSDPKHLELKRTLDMMTCKIEELNFSYEHDDFAIADIAHDSGFGDETPVIQASIDALCLLHHSAVSQTPIPPRVSRDFMNQRAPSLREAHLSNADTSAYGAYDESFHDCVNMASLPSQ